VALTLALLGIAASWQDRTARLLGAIAIGGLLFALGHNSVFHGVLYALVPMVEKARNPSTAIFIFHLGLSALIAYGIDSYRSVSDSLVKRVAGLLCGFAGIVALMIWALLATKTPAEDRLGIVVVAGLLLAWQILVQAGRINPLFLPATPVVEAGRSHAQRAQTPPILPKRSAACLDLTVPRSVWNQKLGPRNLLQKAFLRRIVVAGRRFFARFPELSMLLPLPSRRRSSTLSDEAELACLFFLLPLLQSGLR